MSLSIDMNKKLKKERKRRKKARKIIWVNLRAYD